MSAIDSINSTVIIQEGTFRAVKLFWETTAEHTDTDMLLYVARSYAYIGQILTKRKNLFEGETKLDFPSIQYIDEMIARPYIALEKAFALAPQDTTVLNRYGRALWNDSRFMKDAEKIQVLKKAEEILTKSIDSEHKQNWFAYATRLAVRKDIGNSLLQNEVNSKIDYYKLAREDGLQCFRFKCTLKDMTMFADVCQKLAKYPDISRYGPRFVKPEKKKYIIEAVDHLYYGLRLGDSIEYHSTTQMAMCLADLGEFTKAIEWQKRAWLLSNFQSSFPVFILCLFFTMSFEELSKTTDKQTIPLLKDFLYVLKRTKEQHTCENINKMYTMLYKRRHTYILRMLSSSINELSPFDNKTKEVMLDYVQHVLRLPMLTESERESTENIETLLSNEIVVERKEEDFSSIFETKSVESSTNTQSVSIDHEYDFFVCHSHINEDWVKSILLPHLENAYHDGDSTLKGCIADRDFQPGMPIQKNIINAIKQSSKVILILTTDFLDSAWCQYEIRHALADVSKHSRIIPVLLKACEVPDELQHITYIDLTNNENNFNELQRIKDAIL